MMTARRWCRTLLLVLPLLGVAPAAVGDDRPFESVDTTLGPTRALIERYGEDRESLRRFYDAPMSPRRLEREGSSVTITS